MSNPAAFQASYADFKLIKGRKCAQIILEVAIEAADAALEALGGVPQPHRETWVGVARIESKVRQQLEASVALIEKPAKERRKFSELPLSQQAALRCNEPNFWRFLSQSGKMSMDVEDAEAAAEAVRILCVVKSRAEIKHGSFAGNDWLNLNDAYGGMGTLLMARREFSRAVKVGIIKRANRDGDRVYPWCEKCGALAKKFEIHHLREDALEVDKSKPLTAEDGALWCKPCHDEHTKKFSTPAVALAKRQEAANLGADKPNKAKIAQPSKPGKTKFKQDQIAALREAQYARRFGE